MTPGLHSIHTERILAIESSGLLHVTCYCAGTHPGILLENWSLRVSYLSEQPRQRTTVEANSGHPNKSLTAARVGTWRL
jgi:hypothetical protein